MLILYFWVSALAHSPISPGTHTFIVRAAHWAEPEPQDLGGVLTKESEEKDLSRRWLEDDGSSSISSKDNFKTIC